jgi:hypothetical protein
MVCPKANRGHNKTHKIKLLPGRIFTLADKNIR